ncbi:Glyoxylate/hydroxypyruvate reductase B [Rosistilla carotiformis]|uniref:Glyoxylate/hydroxypyruvate reductase B n=1 Tax=Rosistilla carotiformis TaxID=2528017 RepID=A0A518JWG8_9BACT|nr:D-glycerate dehydrogenase [Rosistilla carotiformis]QDV69889.1 Glyoxylate/hydroxypyruvate reductase B [Rosistilla carotiformis]
MKVFITRQIPAAGLDRISSVCDCDVWPERMPPSRDQLQQRAAGCDGVLTLLSDRIDAEFFDAVGPQLKVVSNFAVGYNNIDVAEATRRGIAVGNTPGVLTEATADIAVGLLLAAARRMREGIDNVTNQEWATWEPMGFIGQDLVGKTIGIVGMGRIGAAVARRLHFGWGMSVLYTSRSDKPEIDDQMNARRVELSTLLTESDFVSVHTDLNPQTEKMFGDAAFAQMKPTSVLVNTARGGIIDQEALHQALQSGTIFAAGLDVTEPEPLAADSPLRGLSNCVILPHVGSGTVASRDAMATIAADNLLAGLQGNPLPHQVE